MNKIIGTSSYKQIKNNHSFIYTTHFHLRTAASADRCRIKLLSFYSVSLRAVEPEEAIYDASALLSDLDSGGVRAILVVDST